MKRGNSGRRPAQSGVSEVRALLAQIQSRLETARRQPAAVDDIKITPLLESIVRALNEIDDSHRKCSREVGRLKRRVTELNRRYQLYSERNHTANHAMAAQLRRWVRAITDELE